MALTKIKLNTMVTGTLPDANIPDDITIDSAAAAPASGLTGNTLASGVTASSLTSVGTLTSLNTTGTVTATGNDYMLKAVNTSTTDGHASRVSAETGTSQGKIELDFFNDSSRSAGGYGLIQLGKTSNAPQLGILASGVGIGTNNPSSRLTVKTSSYSSNIAEFTNPSNTTLVGAYCTGNPGSGQFYVKDAGGTTKVLLNSIGDSYFVGGELGIGTSSPTGLLEVANTSGNADIRIRASNSGHSRLYFGDVADVGAGFVDYDHGTDMRFGVEGSTRMTILSDGRVAIKATSLPQDFGGERGQLLISSVDNSGANNYGVLQIQGHSVSNDVATGGIYFYDHSNNNATIQVQRNTSTSTGNMLFYTHNGSALKNRMEIRSDGEVRIGEGEDGYLRHYQINSSSHNYVIYTYSDDSYRWNRNGSGSDEMRLESDGDLVILGSLTQNSDIRLKENIETIPNALSKVNQLRGVTYNWNETSGRDTEAKQIGMIADEVEEVLPELVKVDSVKGSFDEDGLDNIKSLKYGNVVGLLVEAVKELSAKVEELENA